MYSGQSAWFPVEGLTVILVRLPMLHLDTSIGLGTGDDRVRYWI